MQCDTLGTRCSAGLFDMSFLHLQPMGSQKVRHYWAYMPTCNCYLLLQLISQGYVQYGLWWNKNQMGDILQGRADFLVTRNYVIEEICCSYLELPRWVRSIAECTSPLSQVKLLCLSCIVTVFTGGPLEALNTSSFPLRWKKSILMSKQVLWSIKQLTIKGFQKTVRTV